MIHRMSVRVVTTRTLKGQKWAAKYPEKADELWVFAIIDGTKKAKRIGPDTPENRQRAERKCLEWEMLLERASLGKARMIAPLFKDAVKEFSRRGMSHRSWKTRSGREYQLGVMERTWAEIPIDSIDAETVTRFGRDILDSGKSIRTVNGYMDALSLLYRFHEETMPDLVNPTIKARKAISANIDKTASFRAMNESNCNPMTPEEMGKLIAALDKKGNANTTMTVLLCYEAGLRFGEALGLQWGDVWWGADEDDTSRHVHVRRARSGNRVGLTKSGRSRKVSMSRRLRLRLMALYMERGRSPDEEWVITQSWESNIRTRIAAVAKTAKIRTPKVKDLRDTYASTLITHGIVLRWISLQLGHGSLAVTERHYASYMLSEGYQNPWVVPKGSLPSDLFAVLDKAAPPLLQQTPPRNITARNR